MIDADQLDWAKMDGLIPAIVQHAATGEVRMLGYMDRAAIDATIADRLVTFHSRSRGAPWRKGETSGNLLRLVSLVTDCDSDALLVTVEPTGPTCHRGTRSCFDPDGAPAERSTQGFAWLETLWTTIASRAAERPEGVASGNMLLVGTDRRRIVDNVVRLLDPAAGPAMGRPAFPFGDGHSAVRVAGHIADFQKAGESEIRRLRTG